MILNTFSRKDSLFTFVYHTKWINTWEDILNMCQILLDDLITIDLVQVTNAANETQNIKSINKHNIWGTKELQTQQNKILIAGRSIMLNIPICISLTTGTNRLIFTSAIEDEFILEKISQNANVFDPYFSRIEKGGYRTSAEFSGVPCII